MATMQLLPKLAFMTVPSLCSEGIGQPEIKAQPCRSIPTRKP
jgi:hypothetical protein